jgi:hypothetical protein
MPCSVRFQVRAAAVLTLTLMAGACDDPVTPTPPGDDPAPQPNVIACRADVVAETVSCVRPTVDPAPSLALSGILGGQGTYVQLTSSNVRYASGLFEADVTITNLIAQPLGTPDGTTVTGISVFFHSGPVVTSGGGTVTVANPDGTGTFTAAGQPYFAYNTILHQDETSAGKTWQWNVPVTVTAFEFSVYVSTDIPVASGVWEARPSPDFGTVDFTVNIQSSAVGFVRFNLDSFLCGGALVSGSPAFAGAWPITDHHVSIDITDANGYRYVLDGTFGARGLQASGTWALTFVGNTCSGSWQGGRAPPRLVFVSDRAGERQLYLVNADRSGLVQLTNLGGQPIGEPAWSPRGDQIAFRMGVDLFLTDPYGAGGLQLTTGSAEERYPAWFPDASGLAFFSRYSNGSSALQLVNADGTGRMSLVSSWEWPELDADSFGSLSWEPTGLAILLSALGGGPGGVKQKLWRVPLTGPPASPLPATDADANNLDPAFSPDGTMLAFASDRDGDYEIYVLRISDLQLTRLTSNTATDRSPAWSSNSAMLAFTSDRDGNSEVYLMNPDGTGQVNLTQHAADDFRPSWAPW